MISIGGRKHWLWRAVDQDGYVLDEIVQARRDTHAARRLLVRLLKKQRLDAEADRHRQIALIWCCKTGGDARRRTSIAQGPEQPSRKS
uniref:DDE-type integrase/transposase/recombinase n=1 Tax=Rhizobium meliloti TaxID=382 RepID=UPI0035ABBF7E